MIVSGLYELYIPFHEGHMHVPQCLYEVWIMFVLGLDKVRIPELIQQEENPSIEPAAETTV